MGHSIYLADDEKSIRELLHSFLASDGYTVRSFESGDALLEAFRQEPAELVILDEPTSGLDPVSRDELVELMLDTVCSTKPSIRVAGEELPAEVVGSRLLKLPGTHLLYVLDRINENTTEVRHVKPYLLTALYNAPLTMDNHYALMVGHDLSGGSG